MLFEEGVKRLSRVQARQRCLLLLLLLLLVSPHIQQVSFDAAFRLTLNKHQTRSASHVGTATETAATNPTDDDREQAVYRSV